LTPEIQWYLFQATNVIRNLDSGPHFWNSDAFCHTIQPENTDSCWTFFTAIDEIMRLSWCNFYTVKHISTATC